MVPSQVPIPAVESLPPPSAVPPAHLQMQASSSPTPALRRSEHKIFVTLPKRFCDYVMSYLVIL